MAQGFTGATSAGDGIEPESWGTIVRACAVAAAAVCLGGTAAIVAVSQGASAALSLSLMASVVLCGVLTAFAMTYKAQHGESARSPESLLEQQLSARYGVPVQRVAWHVWRIDGELVEATLDPSTGYLTSGGRELHL